MFLSNTTTASKSLSKSQHLPIGHNIQKIMAYWLGNKLSRAHMGIVIQSMDTGKILYTRNSNQLFTPASVLKLLTATAALDYLNPTFSFKTQLFSNGKIIGHTLKGNLYLKFGGDPELSSIDLKHLVDQLHKQGIQKITGHVYIDATDYKNVPYPPGWIWDDLSYAYAAPLMTTIIDRNYFTLSLKISEPHQKHPWISTDLPSGVVNFSNGLVVVKKLHKNCPIRIYSNDKNRYTLRGCYDQRWKQQIRKVAIRDMHQYTRILFQNALKNNNITYHGTIKFKTKAKKTYLITEHRSPPLKTIIKQMLKESDNLTANAVFKKLGEQYFHTTGTWQNSIRALKLILTHTTGIHFKDNLINDGAGLSRYNLISPKQLSKLLYFAYHKQKIRSALVPALPVAGQDGTMKYRLYDQRKGGRIHMKTGSMAGVMALAGFIRTKHQGNLSFVIMINGFVKPRQPYIGIEDDICRYLVNAR